MTILDIIPKAKAVKYTGANSAELLSVVSDMLLATEQAQTASINTANGSLCSIDVYTTDAPPAFVYNVTIDVNHWYVVQGVTVLANNWADGLYQQFFRTMGGAFGVVSDITVPGLGNANFDITIRPGMGSTNYVAVPTLTGSAALLGSLSITNVTGGILNSAGRLDGNTVRVNVANSGVLQLSGAAILVHVNN